VKERPNNVGADVAGCTAGGTAATEDAARAPSAKDAGFRSASSLSNIKKFKSAWMFWMPFYSPFSLRYFCSFVESY
jgi:hypothetical protein